MRQWGGVATHECLLYNENKGTTSKHLKVKLNALKVGLDFDFFLEHRINEQANTSCTDTEINN